MTTADYRLEALKLAMEVTLEGEKRPLSETYQSRRAIYKSAKQLVEDADVIYNYIAGGAKA